MEKELKSELEQNLKILLFGEKKDFKVAKRDIEKVWRRNSASFIQSAPFVLEYIQKFDEIEKPENKAAFISGINLFFLALSDDYFNELKEFTIKAIQNPSGAVRQAIIHTSVWLHMSLSSRIEPFSFEKKKIKKQQSKETEIAKKQLLDFVQDIEELIEKYDDGNDKGDYVNTMKPSVHKSLQVLWNEFTGSHCYRKLMEETRLVSSELFFKRKQIENELIDLLKRSKSFADVDFIKDIIYNETSTEDFQEVLMLFDTGHKDAPEIHEVLEVINDAWNHFPHRSLDGLCPVEMVERYKAMH